MLLERTVCAGSTGSAFTETRKRDTAMGSTLSSVSALLLSVVLFIFGHGLQTTLLPLAADRFYFTDFEIGFISSAYFIGMVAGCFGAPVLILRAGHIRAFAAIVSLMSAAAVLHPVLVDPIAWFAIRVVSGFCLAGFYMIVESWLNEASTNQNRGTVMSYYVVLLFGALMLGQISIAALNISSFIPFVIASIAASLAVMPVSLTTATQPAPITLVRFRPVQLYKNSPAALVGVFLFGIIQGPLLTLTPLFASQIGLASNQAAFYAAAVIGGGMIAQWPVGRLSDMVDRRIVMVGLGVGTGATALLLTLLAPDAFIAAMISAVVIGTFAQPMYAVSVAHAFDHASQDEFVETSSGMLLAFGIGSIIGPLIASILMQQVGPYGLFMMIAIVSLAMVAFLLTRITTRSALSAEDKTDFEYASTAQVGTVISAEPLDAEAEDYVIPPEEFPAYENDIYNFDHQDPEANDTPDNGNEDLAEEHDAGNSNAETGKTGGV